LDELIVADSGPLIALGHLDCLDVLAAIHSRVIVPAEVERECMARLDKPAARTIEAAFSAGWLRHPPERPRLTGRPFATLGPGESAAIEPAEALGAVLPMLMGGNYLPDTETGEVEIARIRIRSTTFDVTCVCARPVDGEIHYRVVDEDGGETLQGTAEARTRAPMTLGEVADFFLGAWPLLEVLEMNSEGDLEGRLDFFSAESEFYPDFDRLCRQRVVERFPEGQEDDDAEGGVASDAAGDRP
jgi:hypothetical protein